MSLPSIANAEFGIRRLFFFFLNSYSDYHIWMDLACTHAENRNLTLITPKWNPVMPQTFFFFFWSLHISFLLYIFSSGNISDNKKATICWFHAFGIKFIHSEYHITLHFYTTWPLYKVWVITTAWDSNSLPSHILLLWFCCIQCWDFLKKVESCIYILVHFSGSRVPNLRKELSSKDKTEFLTLWGNV